MKIYAPVKDANGVWATVRFVNGVGESDDPRLIEYFESHGYRIENEKSNLVIPRQNDEVKVQNDKIEPIVDEDEMMGYGEKTPNFENMNPNELRDWAKANGFGSRIKNIRNKEKLLEIIRG